MPPCASSLPARRSSRCRRCRLCPPPGTRSSRLYTQPDRPAGRGRKLRGQRGEAVRAGARPAGRAAATRSRRRTPSAPRRAAPDLMVVVAYGLILPQAVLDMPRLGCLNIHASLLPRWRGAAPIQRALLAGDERPASRSCGWTPVSIPGPRCARELAIGRARRAGALHDRLATLGAAGHCRGRAQLGGGHAAGAAAAGEGATYAAKIRKAEARIDWREPPRRSTAGARLQPVAGRGDAARRRAGAHLGGAPRAAVAAAPTPCARYRRAAAGGRIVVATGEGALELPHAAVRGPQAAGARFLNARPLAANASAW